MLSTKSPASPVVAIANVAWRGDVLRIALPGSHFVNRRNSTASLKRSAAASANAKMQCSCSHKRTSSLIKEAHERADWTATGRLPTRFRISILVNGKQQRRQRSGGVRSGVRLCSQHGAPGGCHATVSKGRSGCGLGELPSHGTLQCHAQDAASSSKKLCAEQKW